jgi:hypothetical protein
MGIMGIFTLLIGVWQFKVLRGEAMKNPDGSFDDWHEQKSHYGIAVADLLVACPANLLGILLVFIRPQWGYYFLTLVSFWWVWANTMTTATSLRFENPKIDFRWFITFPFGILLGLAYIGWTVANFKIVYAS